MAFSKERSSRPRALTVGIAIVATGLFLAAPEPARAAFPAPFASYGYCQKWTMAAGYSSGGVATTTTAGIFLWATTTNPVFKTTAWGGHISTYNQASSTPSDFVFATGSDCSTSPGTAVNATWDSYSSTTGDIAVGLVAPDVSSTTQKSVLVYYGKASDSDHTTTVSGTGFSLSSLWPFGTSTTNWSLTKTWDVASSNHGAITAYSATSSVPGNIGTAFMFNGYSDRVQTTDNANLSPGTGPLTVMAWFATTDPTGGTKTIFSDRGATSNNLYYIYFDSNEKPHCFWRDSAGNSVDLSDSGTAAAKNTGRWVFVACARNTQTTANLYVFSDTDGLFIRPGTNASLGTITTSDGNPPKIGAQSGVAESSTWVFNGKIDEVRVYQNAVSLADLQTIYNNGIASGRFWTFGAEEAAPGGSGGATSSGASSHLFLNFGKLLLLRGKLIIH